VNKSKVSNGNTKNKKKISKQEQSATVLKVNFSAISAVKGIIVQKN
jgi:hypothetical protein